MKLPSKDVHGRTIKEITLEMMKKDDSIDDISGLPPSAVKSTTKEFAIMIIFSNFHFKGPKMTIHLIFQSCQFLILM
jgi:hypothetical protein